MTLLRNLLALAVLIVIPVVLYLGWNKHLGLAWTIMLSYLGVLGYLVWLDKKGQR